MTTAAARAEQLLSSTTEHLVLSITQSELDALRVIVCSRPISTQRHLFQITVSQGFHCVLKFIDESCLELQAINWTGLFTTNHGEDENNTHGYVERCFE